MFGKIQTLSKTPDKSRLLSRSLAVACLLLATTSHASLSTGNELKLAKATADDLVCHTLSIELQSAKRQGGFNFFPNVEQGCVKRILTHQPQVLQGVSYRRDPKQHYSYNR